MTAMGVFSNVGEVEDGMRTLSPPHSIVDAEDAVAPARAKGAVDFENVRFGYGRPAPALEDFTLHVGAGERHAVFHRVGVIQAGKEQSINLGHTPGQFFFKLAVRLEYSYKPVIASKRSICCNSWSCL